MVKDLSELNSEESASMILDNLIDEERVLILCANEGVLREILTLMKDLSEDGKTWAERIKIPGQIVRSMEEFMEEKIMGSDFLTLINKQ